MQFYDLRIKKSICRWFKLCVEALSLCTKKGFIPLKFKNHHIAWTLQNPYVVRVPKLGVLVRVMTILITFIYIYFIAIP